MSWGSRTHYAPIAIDHTLVSGTTGTAGMPMVFNAACFPDDMMDADGSNPALSDGDDILIASSNDGTGRWSIDIVSFATNNTPASATAQVHARDASDVWFPSATVDEEIFVGWGDAGASQPATGATYGRDEVWQSYDAVYHIEESANTTAGGYLDSTGNGNDATGEGDIASTTGQLGNCWQGDTDATASRLQSGVTTAYTDFSISVWFKDDGNVTSYERLADKNYSTGFYLGRVSTGNTFRFACREVGGTNDDFATITDTDWHYVMAQREGTNSEAFFDGTAPMSTTTTGTAFSTHELVIGGNVASGDRFSGAIDEVRFGSTIFSEDYAHISYQNQNAPATFWTPGTPVAIGGGAAAFPFHRYYGAA